MQAPSWRDFEETQVPDFRPRSPQAELAEVLRRYRADLDAAARSAAEGRAQGLYALAGQAVLAVELERLMDRHPVETADATFEHLHHALRRLKDRMLAQIEEAGLEVVRLLGERADAVAGIAEVEHWRFADSYPSEIVVEELEVAVRLNGVPFRKGRVVMGAPCEHAGAQPVELAGAEQPPGRSRFPRAQTARPADRTRIVCPVEDCGTENEPDAEVCAGCLTLLVSYGRLSLYPDVLFNRGLRAARAGDSRIARECFAAVALWLTDDVRARNAYALACLDTEDVVAARRAWNEVLAFSPDDPLAIRGLRAVAVAHRAARR